MHPQWNGIVLIGLWWFLVLSNDGITLLRNEQRQFYISPLSGTLDREDDRESKKKQMLS